MVDPIALKTTVTSKGNRENREGRGYHSANHEHKSGFAKTHVLFHAGILFGSLGA